MTRAERGGLGLSSPCYSLVPGDLRNLDDLATSLVGSPPPPPCADLAPGPEPEPEPPRRRQTAPLDPSVPTLLLLECVLVYLEPETTSRLLRWFCETFRPATTTTSAIVAYDPFRLQDQFGTVMKRNLAVESFLPSKKEKKEGGGIPPRKLLSTDEAARTASSDCSPCPEPIRPRPSRP